MGLLGQAKRVSKRMTVGARRDENGVMSRKVLRGQMRGGGPSASELVEGGFKAALFGEFSHGGVRHNLTLLDDHHAVAHGLDLLQNVRG